MTYNPAGQILSRGGDHDFYVFTGHGNGSTNSTIDALNRIVRSVSRRRGAWRISSRSD